MFKKLLIAIPILLTVFLCGVALATVRTVQVEFAFTKPQEPPPAPQLLGYKLYREGEFVCSSYKTTVFVMDCRVDVTKPNTLFTMSAYYSDGTEGPQSPTYNFEYSEVVTPSKFFMIKDIENSDKKLVTLTLTAPVNANVVGYNVYANNLLVCEDRDVKDLTINCVMNISGTTTFALTEVFADNTESSFSNPITYAP